MAGVVPVYSLLLTSRLELQGKEMRVTSCYCIRDKNKWYCIDNKKGQQHKIANTWTPGDQNFAWHLSRGSLNGSTANRGEPLEWFLAKASSKLRLRRAPSRKGTCMLHDGRRMASAKGSQERAKHSRREMSVRKERAGERRISSSFAIGKSKSGKTRRKQLIENVAEIAESHEWCKCVACDKISMKCNKTSE